MEVRLNAREVLEATVKPSGNGAHIVLPKDMVGEDVLVIRLPRRSAP